MIAPSHPSPLMGLTPPLFIIDTSPNNVLFPFLTQKLVEVVGTCSCPPFSGDGGSNWSPWLDMNDMKWFNNLTLSLVLIVETPMTQGSGSYTDMFIAKASQTSPSLGTNVFASIWWMWLRGLAHDGDETCAYKRIDRRKGLKQKLYLRSIESSNLLSLVQIEEWPSFIYPMWVSRPHA